MFLGGALGAEGPSHENTSADLRALLLHSDGITLAFLFP